MNIDKKLYRDNKLKYIQLQNILGGNKNIMKYNNTICSSFSNYNINVQNVHDAYDIYYPDDDEYDTVDNTIVNIWKTVDAHVKSAPEILSTIVSNFARFNLSPNVLTEE